MRGNDSFEAFEETLQLARELEVDALLLSGDLFHENKPSRRCMHRTMELLRHYCMGSRACALELLSDPSVNFPSRFGTVNYEDPNYNVALPVFAIHGNHDDPTGDGNLSALDLLSTAGLINYFGKAREVDDITLMPVLLGKGQTRVALYGLGNVRDERLHRTFLSRKVRMLAPPGGVEGDGGAAWFSMLLFHQNRVAHGATSVIPESFLDDALDLVVWGHEHDNQIEPWYCAQRDFYVTQPGSTVATSLSEGEARGPKSVALLEVTGRAFKLHAIALKTVRPFAFGDASLQDARPALGPHDAKAVERHLSARIDALAGAARAEWAARRGAEASSSPLPLVRLRVDCSGGYAALNAHRLGHALVDRVANPKDCVVFHRRRGARAEAAGAGAGEGRAVASLVGAAEDAGAGPGAARMDDLVQEYLRVQSLDLLPQNEFGDTVRMFVEKDDRDAIEGFVKGALDRTCATLQARAVRAYDAASLRLEIERERRQREMEWTRLHQNLDAVLTHRVHRVSGERDAADADADGDAGGGSSGSGSADAENDPRDTLHDSDLEDLGGAAVPRKRPTASPARGARGRGRGRGGASAGRGGAFATLPMQGPRQ